MLNHYADIEYEYERRNNPAYRPSQRLGIRVARRNVKSIPKEYLKGNPIDGSEVIRYRFYDVETEGKISVMRNYSGWTYLGGDIYSFEEFAKKFPNEKRPSSNLVDTDGADQVIKSHNISFLFNSKKDKVI